MYVQVGWKVGWNHESSRRRLGVDKPAVGVLSAATTFTEGTPVTLAGTTNPGAEFELALRVGVDGRVATVGLAVELLDITPPYEAEAALAANLWHRAAVLGAVEVPYTLGLLDGVVVRATGIDPTNLIEALGDPDEIVARVARDTDGALLPGQVVLSGSVTPMPVWVKPGDRLHAEADRLGTLDVEFV